jgi:hypothetical protein
MMHDVKTRTASWKTDSIARSSWSWVQIAHQHALCPEIQVAFYPDVLPLHIVSPASHRPSPVSTSFSTFTFQNPSCLLSPPTTCLQAQFILCLILALQLRLSICHALIAMSPHFYPFTSFTLRLPLIFTPECVPFKPRKKSPSSIFSALLIILVFEPSLYLISVCHPFVFPTDILVISMSMTSSRHFPSTLNTKKKIPICSR